METNKPTGTTGTETATAGNKPVTTTGQHGTGQAARPSFERPDDTGVGQQVNQMADRAAEAAEQAKQAVSEAWDRTSQGLNQTYQQAKDYGRENPGTMTLIAFGAGIGIGLLLAGGATSRSRTRRIVPPVMNALSEIATVFLR